MVTVKGGKGAEILNHVDLLDMPDSLGTNSDHDARYLKLDQTTPQDISNGQPDFLAGLRAGATNQLSIDASGNILTTGTFGAGATTLTGYLSITGGGILNTGTTVGYTIPSGAGTRLMWIPSKGAFRCGIVSGTQWDDANIGVSSFAIGEDTTAQGQYSVAWGYNSSAFGTGAFATSGSFCAGDNSLAMSSASVYGYSNASFAGAAVCGYSSFAAASSQVGDFAYPCSFNGTTTVTIDELYGDVTARYLDLSEIEVYSSTENKAYFTSEVGNATFNGTNTLVVLAITMATGTGNISELNTSYATAFGMGWAKGNKSFACSSATVTGESASGFNNSTVTGFGAFGIGTNTAQAYNQVVIGEYNVVEGTLLSRVNTDKIFVIGNGIDSGTTSNAFSVTWEGVVQTHNKVSFTQTDGNEFIDSLNDGYLDLGATTGIRVNNFVRHTSANYRRYYHLPLASSNPGASGATWTTMGANNLCGWQLNASTETLEFQADVHADWDAASDLVVEIKFALLDAGVNNDTVDLKLVSRYMGVGDIVTKTQTIEVATITDGTQYKVYKATFNINFDEVANVVEVGDVVCFMLNLETDTSEIDNVLIIDGSFSYNTAHTYVESGDV